MLGTFISLLLTSLINESLKTSFSDGIGPTSIRLVSGINVSVLYKMFSDLALRLSQEHVWDVRSVCLEQITISAWSRPTKSVIQNFYMRCIVRFSRSGVSFSTAWNKFVIIFLM